MNTNKAAAAARETRPDSTRLHLSDVARIVGGEVLGSGTVTGGSGLELDRWLCPGDVIELEIEGIGVLRNRVRRDGR